MLFQTGLLLMGLSILGLLYMLYTTFIKKTNRYNDTHSTISIVGLQLGMLALFFVLTHFIDTQKEFLGTSSYVLILIYASSLGMGYLIPSVIIHHRAEKGKNS